MEHGSDGLKPVGYDCRNCANSSYRANSFR